MLSLLLLLPLLLLLLLLLLFLKLQEVLTLTSPTLGFNMHLVHQFFKKRLATV